MVLLLYMDDIILIGDNQSPIAHLVHTFKCTLSMKDIGSLHYFLDIKIHHALDWLFLSQSKYAHAFLGQVSTFM